jgi:hypothetical protein
VCLRCQHAERAAKRARQRQLLARGTATALVLAVIAAVGIAGATAIRARVSLTSDERAVAGDASLSALTSSSDSNSQAATDSTMTMSPAPAPVVTPVRSVAPSSVAPSSVAPSVAASAVRSEGTGSVSPVVPVGRTALRDTMVADRAGDTVRVRFDLVLARTRRADKFEAIVRSTLPQVYGAVADSALRTMPAGAVARAGDLIATLPERGFQIPLAGGRTIAVWPEMREGRDGPLVVGYRALAR